MSTPFDHAAAYRDLLGRLHIANPGDRVVAYEDLARGTVRCFALREGDGVRLKACITPTGAVRDGAAAGDDWPGLLGGAPDAMTAAAWIAWLQTDESPAVHSPRVPVPIVVLTPASAGTQGYARADRAKVTAPALVREPSGLTLTAWFHVAGATVPERWVVRARSGGTQIERSSATELP